MLRYIISFNYYFLYICEIYLDMKLADKDCSNVITQVDNWVGLFNR